MAPISTDSPLVHSVAYQEHIPDVMIAVSSIYAIVFLGRQVLWLFRRLEQRLAKSQHDRLHLFWKEKMTSTKHSEEGVDDTAMATDGTTVSTLDSISHSSAAGLLRHDSHADDENPAKKGAKRSKAKRLIGIYWLIHKKKRRRLIWDWSVSMGYCSYDHASRMNDLVSSAEEKQRQGKPTAEAE